MQDVRNYITENRLNNVLSKIGRPDVENAEQMEEIKEEFTKDVLDNFDENNERILDMLKDEQKKWLRKRVRAEADALINKI